MSARDDLITIPDALMNALRESAQVGALVVGIGSPQAGDNIGWHLADLIGQQKLVGIEVRRAAVPLDLLDWLDDFSIIHVIDAMQCAAGEAPHRCWHWPDCGDLDLMNSATTSHNFDLVSVLRLASSLGKKTDIFLWGVSSIYL